MTSLAVQALWELPATLIAGVLLNLTPCVLPAIPVKIRTILRDGGRLPRSRWT